MQNRFIPTLFFSLSALAIAPFIVPGIAYQQFASHDRIDAAIHLNSEDAPIAGRPISTQFLFTGRSNRISLENCNCQVSIQDWRDRIIVDALPLRETMIEGKAAIATEITFPKSGSYTVVLSGYHNTAQAFEIRFPITAIDSVPTY